MAAPLCIHLPRTVYSGWHLCSHSKSSQPQPFLPCAPLPPVTSRSHQLAQPQAVCALGPGPHTCLFPAAPHVPPCGPAVVSGLARQAGSGPRATHCRQGHLWAGGGPL